MVKKNKRQQNIKNKLIAAIAMLLVSSIMMVSSTYAWFTLSTAPEVTGITTSVGANGNLEMALLPESGITTDIQSTASDGNKAWNERNITWGNLVDVSDTTYYGMDKITLYPAELNLAEDGTLKSAMLKTPGYGPDGRVTDLLENTSTGIYDTTEKGFYPDSAYGVRAIGTASGMTNRQLSYRNAQGAANTAMNLARTKASQSLNANGSSLANIAIKYGMDGTAATFGKADVEALRAIVDGLNGEGGVLDQIETAYMQYILAFAASGSSGLEDTAFGTFKGVVEEAESLADLKSKLTENNITLPSEISTYIGKYETTLDSVNTADTTLQGYETTLESNPDATFTWTEIRAAMEPLANPDKMVINGFAPSEVKDKLGELVSSITAQGGLKVIMATDAGVYADIADQCGDYTASITIEKVEYNGITLNNMNARMETATTVKPSYLQKVGAAVVDAGAPEDGAEGTMPITDMYGYIIDMAFRTNAADSNLLLQTTPVDRIYEGNETGVSQLDGASNKEISTMGNGSTMTFKATNTDFSNDQVKALMKAVRIVFFNPSGNTILAYAKLDADTAVITADGIVANIYLYENVAQSTTSYTAVVYADDSDATATYYTANDGTDVVVDAPEVGQTYYVKTTTVGTAVETMITEADKAVITPLAQGQAQTVSVLVYLDGNLVTNKDVAATGSTSVTGSMNLQFASSANLTPMNYTDLMEQGNETTAASTTAATTTP